jgi:hypothetical protein
MHRFNFPVRSGRIGSISCLSTTKESGCLGRESVCRLGHSHIDKGGNFGSDCTLEDR